MERTLKTKTDEWDDGLGPKATPDDDDDDDNSDDDDISYTRKTF